MKLEHLKQLIAFAEDGTLSKVAGSYHLSQPSLSRNMMDLEKELQVELFERHKNKLSLTETGHYAVQESRDLFAYLEDFQKRLQVFDEANQNLVLATSHPILQKRLQEAFPRLVIRLLPAQTSSLDLLDSDCDVLLLPNSVQAEGVSSRFYIEEKLSVSLPSDSSLVNKQSLTFEDLLETSIVVRKDIGDWKAILNKYPNLNIIYQDNEAFENLVQNFHLPTFVTNLSQDDSQTRLAVTRLPLSGEDSSLSYYLHYKSDNYKAEKFVTKLLENPLL